MIYFYLHRDNFNHYSYSLTANGNYVSNLLSNRHKDTNTTSKPTVYYDNWILLGFMVNIIGYTWGTLCLRWMTKCVLIHLEELGEGKFSMEQVSQ